MKGAPPYKLPYFFPHTLGPTLMTCGRFDAVRLAAACPNQNEVFIFSLQGVLDFEIHLRPQLPPHLFAVPRTQCEPVIISAFEPGAGSSEWMSVSSLTLFFVVLSVLRRRWDIGDSAVVSTNRGEAARRRVDEVRTKLSNESMG